MYSWTETKILNLLRSDFKYLTDFGFRKKCRIPSYSDADLESVASLLVTCAYSVFGSIRQHGINMRIVVISVNANIYDVLDDG